MQQKYFYYPWAIAGDLTPGGIPNPIDGSGYVSYDQGFTFDYQRDLQTDSQAKSIQRVTINSVLNDITVNLQNYQQYGTPEWIDAADNNGVSFPYDGNAIVRYAALTWFSTTTANTDTPGTSNKWKNITQVFENYGQSGVLPAVGVLNVASPAANTNYPLVTTITPPVNGYISVIQSSSAGSIPATDYGTGIETSMSITGTGVTNVIVMGNTNQAQQAVVSFGRAQVTAGNTVTITCALHTTGTACNQFEINAMVQFFPA